ncbi:hypothetical protein B0H16DRAFT_1492046 [Mycena metata]|uniref:WD40 repeat-like protein n=1 Tax=Mycena metata TaxID=1033252 RepID=A0AAD7KEZ6_9AGAR|nr:hypothetical protein B0H16DRAFT_1492046 [Mycena metata]
MPPRELPGFYFDAERNRYFPLSSRPPPTTSTDQSQTVRNTDAGLAPEEDEPRRRRRVLWSSNRATETTAAGRAREASALLHARLALTQRGCAERVRWPFSGGSNVCAFRTTPTRQVLGDERGWLYSRAPAESSEYPPHYRDPNEDDGGGGGWTEWSPELCLSPGSEISVLCTTDTRCVAVCFGPATKICVQDAGAPGRTALLHLSAVRDVRAASLQDRALVLGAARHAVLLPDLDAPINSVRTLSARSDVFAVAQRETLVYAGTRAGGVLRFDTRDTNAKCAQLLFESGPDPGTPSNTSKVNAPQVRRLVNAPRNANTDGSPPERSSIVFVQPTHGGQALVVGCMDGRLATYDLRFVRPTAPPTVSYSGQPSALSHSGRLGIALDPAERFLFAAGADHRLRAWALNSGAPVVPPSAPTPSSQSSDAASSNSYIHPSTSNAPPQSRNPFATRFIAPLSALQVVEAEDGPGTVMWAGGGGEVWRWRLGV